MLTKKGKYGLKAMAHLAQFPPGRLVHVVDIAEEQQIPKRFLNAILFELRTLGFVSSKMGKNGGYTLAREAETITVGEIIRAIDGPLAPIACASKTRYERCDDCVSESHCAVRLTMIEAQRALSGVMDNCTLARLVELGRRGAESGEAPPPRLALVQN